MTVRHGFSEVRLRLVCQDRPPAAHAGQPAEFGLQDQQRRLDPGAPGPDGLLHFSVTVAVRPHAATGAPDYAGPAVHGPPGGRFLYLGWRIVDAPDWLRRWKLPLGGITWEQIAAAQTGAALVATVSAAGGSTIQPLGAGWVVE